MSNLVQELVQEMGPNNPALNGNPGMPMGAPSYADQGMVSQGQQMMPQGMQMMGPQGPPQQPQMVGPQLPAHYQQQAHQQIPGPPDGYTSDEQQMHEMMNLGQFGMDEEHRPVADRAMDRGREALFLAVVFFILSLPQTDQFIQRMVPQVSGNFYYLLVLKGVVLAAAFFLARYFEIV